MSVLREMAVFDTDSGISCTSRKSTPSRNERAFLRLAWDAYLTNDPPGSSLWLWLGVGPQKGTVRRIGDENLCTLAGRPHAAVNLRQNDWGPIDPKGDVVRAGRRLYMHWAAGLTSSKVKQPSVFDSHIGTRRWDPLMHDALSVTRPAASDFV